MKLKFRFDPIPVFGWCVNSDPIFFKQMVTSVDNGGLIVQESIRKLNVNDEYAYVFYDSIQPLVVAKIYIGKVEYKGFYPEPTAPYGYTFHPQNQLHCKGLLIDDTLQGPDMIVLDSKKL